MGTPLSQKFRIHDLFSLIFMLLLLLQVMEVVCKNAP